MTTFDLHRESTSVPATGLKPVATSVPASSFVPAKVDDRYLDVLVAVSLVQVVTVRTFGWDWLPYAFPGVAVLIAVAGARVAGSLDRAEHRPLLVLKQDGWRLLAPLWLLGVVLVPLMMVHQGWVPGQGDNLPLGLRGLLNWLVPLGDPGATEWGRLLTEPLWLIRANMWFLLLSPAFLWMFRRWPRRTAAFPLVLLPLAAFGLLDAGTLPESSHSELVTLAGFGACWMIGFAYHDGTLARIPWRVVVPLGLGALELVGIRATAATGLSPGVDALVSTAYCLGAVILLLRLQPGLGWTRRTTLLERMLTVINARTLTFYVWINPVVYLAGVIVAAGVLPTWLPVDRVGRGVTSYLLSWPLLGVAALAFGWAENLGNRRRSRLLGTTGTGCEGRVPMHWGRRATAFGARPRIALGALVMVATASLIGLLWWLSDGYQPPVPAGHGAYPSGALASHARPGWRLDGFGPAAPGARATSSGGRTSGPADSTDAVSDAAVGREAGAGKPPGSETVPPRVAPCRCARASTASAPATPSHRGSVSASAGQTVKSPGPQPAPAAPTPTEGPAPLPSPGEADGPAEVPPPPAERSKHQTGEHGRAVGKGKVKPPPPRRTVDELKPTGRAASHSHRLSTGL